MLPVLAGFCVIYLAGWVFDIPVRRRMVLIAALYGLVVLSVLVLPPSGLRAALGDDVRPWIVLGGFAALVLGYRRALGVMRQRARAEPEAPVAASPTFSEAELDRYARHILLREIGGTGQRRLRHAKVLVIGAGGLGSPVCLYLAAAGVGTIGVIDDDRVDSSNLQRQIIHRDDGIGMPKVHSAAQAMRALNPFIEVRPYQRRLDAALARELVADYDLVIDGTDNFDTRYMVNEIAVAQGKPLLAGAITQWEGQVSLYHPAAGGPCFHCVFPARPAAGMVPTCAEAGVAAPLPGVIGSVMATEAVKHLTGAGQTLTGRLMIYDALYAETRTITLHKRADCPVCGVATRQGA